MSVKAKAASWCKELEKRREAIGKERDKLRDMISDAQDLDETCREALQQIEEAIDKLSELA